LRYSNKEAFFKQVEDSHLLSMNESLTAFYEGLTTSLPCTALFLFTPSELEDLICGPSEIDISLLKRVTEYEGELDENTPHIQYFWEALERMDQVAPSCAPSAPPSGQWCLV
jgi:hypothetical protein